MRDGRYLKIRSQNTGKFKNDVKKKKSTNAERKQSTTSPPGGNLVDGLPLASSNLASSGQTSREATTNKLMTRQRKSEVYEKSEHSIRLRSSKSQQIYYIDRLIASKPLD